MRDQRLIIGRYDARFEGTDLDAAGEDARLRSLEHRHHGRVCVGIPRLSGSRAEVHVEGELPCPVD